MARSERPGPNTAQTPCQAAGGRPIGVGWTTFAEAAERLLENGYAPLPIRPGEKAPAAARWSTVTIDEARIVDWTRQFPEHGVGIRTGPVVGLDIDCLDADLAHQIEQLAIARFGSTLVRVGLWPKRLLLYRAGLPFAKLKAGPVEILGLGQQFVAFGRHPGTGHPYYWPNGETPLGVPVADLPGITEREASAFLAEAAACLPEQAPTPTRGNGSQGQPQHPGEIRREGGRVVDGRDAWLSSIAFHAVWDARDADAPLDPAALAERVWQRFTATADLGRPRKDGRTPYSPADALRKVTDKLRLLDACALPSRAVVPVQPVSLPGRLTVPDARSALDRAIATACNTIRDWHETGGDPPEIGLRATVGLGKTTLARHHLLRLRAELAAAGGPDRIVIFTPSHALASEAAGLWRNEGLTVAVLLGYEARHPVHRRPMCARPGPVRLAIEAGVNVRRTACDDGEGHRCPHIATCLKEANRRDIAGADIVIAAYDALWSGLGCDADRFGAIVIDEACWPRALMAPVTLLEEEIAAAGLGMATRPRRNDRDAEMADLDDLRRRVLRALTANGPGCIARDCLTEVGLDAAACRAGAALERRRISELPLRPGEDNADLERAGNVARQNARAQTLIRLWTALGDLLEGAAQATGRVRVEPPDAGSSDHRIAVSGVQTIHPTLAGKPVLHLDATLRQELARIVLPRIETRTVEANAPHMHLTLITGGFGKSALVPDGRHRSSHPAKLDPLVTHVRWQARRVDPGRVLVITYKDIEAAFQGIHGVETAHFNAIAGLDGWRDVASIVIVGRPLPSDLALARLAATAFGQVPEGGYGWTRRGITLRDGSVRGVRTLVHRDPSAEILRAAICEDELVQAIGRGRGVNRTAETPLAVQVFADVALPLVHDALMPWEVVAPDAVQRMLLDGIAVDSPKDATLLHPELLGNEKQAQKAFERAVFKRQIPYSTYRGMSLKSATYRRAGRGAGWQRAYWLEGDEHSAFQALTATLGALAGWSPG